MPGSGIVTSIPGELLMVNRKELNLTLICRKSFWSSVPVTSTVIVPLVLPSVLNSGVGFLSSNDTMFRIKFLFKLIDWVLRKTELRELLLTNRPISSSLSCIACIVMCNEIGKIK